MKRCDFGPGYGAGRTLSVRQVPNRPIGGVDFPAFDEHPRPVRLVSLEFVIQICGDQRCGSARSQRIPSLGRNLPRMVTISANPVLSLPRPLVDLDRRLAAARALICVLRNVGALGSWQRHNPGPLFVTEKRRAVDRRVQGSLQDFALSGHDDTPKEEHGSNHNSKRNCGEQILCPGE